MKNDDDFGQEVGSGDLLDLARRNVARLLRELDAMLSELEGGAKQPGAAAKAVATELRKAVQTVFEERLRLEKLHSADSGSDEPSGLVLDIARAEIGRRLACLRERS